MKNKRWSINLKIKGNLKGNFLLPIVNKQLAILVKAEVNNQPVIQAIKMKLMKSRLHRKKEVEEQAMILIKSVKKHLLSPLTWT